MPMSSLKQGDSQVAIGEGHHWLPTKDWHPLPHDEGHHLPSEECHHFSNKSLRQTHFSKSCTHVPNLNILVALPRSLSCPSIKSCLLCGTDGLAGAVLRKHLVREHGDFLRDQMVKSYSFHCRWTNSSKIMIVILIC